MQEQVSVSMLMVETVYCCFGCVRVGMGVCDTSVDMASVRVLVELVVVVVSLGLLEVVSVGTIEGLVGGFVWLISQGNTSK